MPSQEDYILRHIALLRQFLAQAVGLRSAGRPEQALVVILQAQEKLFARPAAAVAALSIDDQLRLLGQGEPPDLARASQLGYASLLREAGLACLARDHPAQATGAFQLALHVTLTVALEDPAGDGQHLPALAELLSRIPLEELNPVVREMLGRIGDLPAV